MRREVVLASTSQVYLIGGSIPETAGGQLFNTATVWCPEGNLLATHRKIHLFDIDIPGRMTFKESDALSPGSSFTSFSTPWCEVGLGICYDIRFAQLAQVLAGERGCQLLVYPGAFNMTTGPAHWELLARARALDNQLYVATPSPARDEEASYTGNFVNTDGDRSEYVWATQRFFFSLKKKPSIPLV